MSSIVGEKSWHNAEDLASINASITTITNSLNSARELYQVASDTKAVAVSQGLVSVAKWGNLYGKQYSSSKALIDKYTVQLSDLLKLQQKLSATQQISAITTSSAAAAQEALAKADMATTSATAGKWALYGGIALGAIALIVGGIYLYKKLKK